MCILRHELSSDTLPRAAQRHGANRWVVACSAAKVGQCRDLAPYIYIFLYIPMPSKIMANQIQHKRNLLFRLEPMRIFNLCTNSKGRMPSCLVEVWVNDLIGRELCGRVPVQSRVRRREELRGNVLLPTVRRFGTMPQRDRLEQLLQSELVQVCRSGDDQQELWKYDLPNCT
eukprot:SAG11_NODE_8708_length_985_cov_1.048533_1_plen_172_part_00